MLIAPDSLDHPDVEDLAREHLAHMLSISPAESVHALDLASLAGPDVSLWSARDDDGTLLAIGALLRLSDGWGELKSMRTAAAARGRGVASALLTAIIEAARRDGIRTIALETGSEDAFAPARALYERHGFAEIPPFGAYLSDPLSRFYALEIAPR